MEQARLQQQRFGGSSTRTSIFGDINTGEISNQHQITPFRTRDCPPLPNRTHYQEDHDTESTMAPSREVTKLKSQVAKLEQEKTADAAKIKSQAEKIKARDKLVKDLQSKILSLRAASGGGRRKKSRKDEQNDDTKVFIKTFVLEVVFRTVKFAGDALPEVCEMVWNGIKDKNKLEEGANPLDLQEFTDIYDSWVLHCLSKRRQYATVRAGKAAFGENMCSGLTDFVYFTVNVCT